MARDAKLDEIELKRDNFNTESQEVAAQRLEEEWPINFSDLAEMYDGPSRTSYQKVYNEYFGPLKDDRTVEEIRREYGSVKEYVDRRKRGLIDLDTVELSEDEWEQYREGYSDGFSDGFKRGLADAQADN